MDKLKVSEEDEDEEMDEDHEEEEEEEQEDAALEDVKDLYEDEEGTGKKRKRSETDDGDEKVGKKKVRPLQPNYPLLDSITHLTPNSIMHLLPHSLPSPEFPCNLHAAPSRLLR